MLTIGDRLKMARERKGVTQTKTSEDTGINNKTLSGYERNISEPDIETLKLLAKYYNISFDFILGKTDKITSYENTPDNTFPGSFETPEDAIEFLLKQNIIMGFGGFDMDKLSNEEKVEFANSLLEHLKLLSLKYKK